MIGGVFLNLDAWKTHCQDVPYSVLQHISQQEKQLKIWNCMAVFLLVLAHSSCGYAQDDLSFIYLVRHAEKQAGPDPALTPIGEQRAENYAEWLGACEIQHVFSTETQRTTQTATPLAEKLKLEVQSYDPQQLDKFAEQLKSVEGNVFVVGHSNTTPQLVELLGGDAGEPIDESSEFDRVYQLVIQDGQVIHTNRFASSHR